MVFFALRPILLPEDSSLYNKKYVIDTEPDKSSEVDDKEKQDDDYTGIDCPSEQEDTENTEELPIQYVCPEKLAEVRAINADVYAWITIPGTNVDYPVIQSPSNDSYYLRRDINGNYLASGTLMTEHLYNGTDFEDPVTIIYGHSMKSGAMFGNLQTYYSSRNGIDDYKIIEIYLPDKKLEYEVFAAVPYDMRHILYNYDFNDYKIYTAFFKSIISIRAFNSNINPELTPQYGDKVLILSTCLRGDSTKRYLVIAKLNKNISRKEFKK